MRNDALKAPTGTNGEDSKHTQNQPVDPSMVVLRKSRLPGQYSEIRGFKMIPANAFAHIRRILPTVRYGRGLEGKFTFYKNAQIPTR